MSLCTQINKECAIGDCLKSKHRSVFVNFANQFFLVCRSPYKDFMRQQYCPGCGREIPGVGSMYTSSLSHHEEYVVDIQLVQKPTFGLWPQLM